MGNDDRFRLTFLGAARTVTGSMHRLDVQDHSVLVDCGTYQGRRKDSTHRNRHFSNKAVEVDDVLLTHAHIDHSGNIPTLVKRGFKGNIHCTHATAELCSAMLVNSVEKSKQLNSADGPMIIISASGMCEGGRVVHHLRNSVEDDKNMIIIVGYQAQHTLGRRIVERRDRVKIFGVERNLCAEVRVLNAFSAHADRDELLWWADGCGEQVRKFFLVHGDEDQSEAFRGRLEERHKTAVVPRENETIDLAY